MRSTKLEGSIAGICDLGLENRNIVKFENHSRNQYLKTGSAGISEID